MCAPAVVGLSALLESEGIPAVGMHAMTFRRVAASAARSRGIAAMPTVFVPDTLDGRTAADYREIIRGLDPISGRPVFDELIEGLTVDVAEDLTGAHPASQPGAELIEVADEQAARDLFEACGWTDHLPIVVPTAERVSAMLAGTSRAASDVVGQIAPAWSRVPWGFSVERVAVNAVMAGARPEYLPVILALFATGESARMSSLTSMGTIGVVNGPIRTEIGMDAGIGAMGPFNHANATIGRAFAMGSANLQGGADPGDTYMGTLGNPYNYSAVYPENEEASPWAPMHLRHGFSPEHSAVSVLIGAWQTTGFYGPRHRDWEAANHASLSALSAGMAMPPLIVMDPRVAGDFVEAGYDKAAVAEWIGANSSFDAQAIEIMVIGGNTKGYAKAIAAARLKTISVDGWR